MVNLVEYLVDEAVIVESDGSWTLQRDPASIEVGVPENVRQLIERQIERLDPDERRVLEGASVVGMECSSVAIAAGLEEQPGWVEERCEALVRRHQFLLPARLVELPDGTVTPRYTFSHVLYRDVPYGLLAPMRRVQTHRRIGDRGEAIYGDRATEIAAELAMHFEQGRDAARAVKYLLLAAENATGWSAHHEAAALAHRGLLALAALSDTRQREECELALTLVLGVSLVVTKGFAAAETDQVFRRAWQLCGHCPDSAAAFKVLRLIGLSQMFRGEIQAAHETGERLMKLAMDLRDSILVMEAHRALGGAAVESGALTDGIEHFDRVLEHYAGGPSLLRALHRPRSSRDQRMCAGSGTLGARLSGSCSTRGDSWPGIGARVVARSKHRQRRLLLCAHPPAAPGTGAHVAAGADRCRPGRGTRSRVVGHGCPASSGLGPGGRRAGGGGH